MGFFKKKAPKPARDAAAQWRINRTRRQSFAPAYFAKQAFLFISLTILVFFVDIAIYIVFQFAIYNNPDYEGSPASTTFEITDALNATQNENGEITYSLPDNTASRLDQQKAWAILVGNDGTVLWSHNAPSEIADRTYTQNDIATAAREFYLENYPTFFGTTRDDGTVIVGYPIDEYVKFPIRYMGNREFIGVIILGIVLLYLDALIFFMVYSLSRRRMLKSITPAVESLDDLAHGMPTHMEMKGPLADIAESVNAASAIIQHKDEARKRWVSGVSHDVRTPLAISMGHAERIANATNAPAEVRESGEVIVRQNERIRDLVEDLNIVSKLEYDSQPMNIETIQVVPFARGIVTDYLNTGIDVQYDLEFFDTPTVQECAIQGDERLLRRAVRNLIDNAMRHNGEGCKIALSLDIEPSGMLSITVADNGRGCDTSRIGALMAQASTPDASYDAHGLGLTLVSRISIMHGGYVSFASEPGRGFTATMRIPAAMPQSEPPRVK